MEQKIKEKIKEKMPYAILSYILIVSVICFIILISLSCKHYLAEYFFYKAMPFAIIEAATVIGLSICLLKEK